MNPEPPLERVEELFNRVIDLPRAEREQLLELECRGDGSLRAAVDTLLAHDEANRQTKKFMATGLSPPFAAGLAEAPTLLKEKEAAPASVSPSPPGYELGRVLGSGGMGIVYEARQLSLDRPIAIKMLLGDGPASADLLARFRSEAHALARLHHPNIVQIYEIGDVSGRPYIAMELVDGPSLGRQTNGRPQPFERAARLVEILARTIHAVHESGLIHRDLKPGNILLGKKEQKAEQESAADMPWEPKITDFGIAKDLTAKQQLTPSGHAMGTPSYMAPEQSGKSGPVGPGADVYALGAILYELLVGRPPFEGASVAETIMQVLVDEPVPPRSLRPQVPRDLETICVKCLQKEPSKRYANAWDLAEDLRRFLNGEPIRARPVRGLERLGRWCRRRPLVASLLGLIILLTLGLLATVVAYNARLQGALSVTAALEAKERRQLVQLHVSRGMHTLEEGDTLTGLVWLTRALVLDEDNAAGQEAYRVRIGTALRQCPRLLRLLALDQAPLDVWLGTDDGRLAALDANGLIRVYALQTNAPIGPDIQEEAVIRAAFSSDGRLLATANAKFEVRIWDAATSRPACPVLAGHARTTRLVFGNENRMIVAIDADFRIQAWDVATGKPILLPAKLGMQGTFALLSDDGHWLLRLDGDGTASVWDIAAGKRSASFPIGAAPASGAFSRDGSRVALVTQESAVEVWDVRAGKRLGQTLAPGRRVNHVSFSPDGRSLLTACADKAARIWAIGIAPTLAFDVRHESSVRQAVFSPDGKRFATCGDDDRAQVWDALSGTPVTPPLLHNGSVSQVHFSSDGGKLLTIDEGGGVRWWELPPAGGPAEGSIRTTSAGPAPLDKVDGRRLQWLEDRKSVQVIDAATGKPLGLALRHASAINAAAFSPDGRRVVTANDDNTAQVWDADSGTRLGVRYMHKGSVLSAAFSPDGLRIVTGAADGTARVWDVVTGIALTPPLNHSRAVVRVAFGRDGSGAITTCRDGTTCAWDLRPDERPPRTLELLAEVLAGSRIGDAQQMTPLDSASLQSIWRELQPR